MKLEIDLRCRGLSRAGFVELYYHSEDFNMRAQADADLDERTVMEPEHLGDGRVRRRVRIVPRVALPAPLRRALAHGPLAYVEVFTFDPDHGQAVLEVESAARDRVTVRGSLNLEERPDLLHFRFAGHVRVDVPLLGGFAERFIAAEVRQRYGTLERFLQDYVDAAAR